MDDLEFRRIVKVDVTVLQIWLDQGWLLPQADDGRRQYGPADVARAQLIIDLTQRMGVNDEGVDLIIDLVDQIHGLRGTMHEMLDAMERQDDDIRHRIRDRLDHVRRLRGL